MQVSSDLFIIVGSALAAAASFAAFAYPYLQRSDKKERFKSVIEKKRKALFEQSKEELNRKGPKNVSAKDSMTAMFKLQKLAGEHGEKVRTTLLQAGIRGADAPLKYMLAQISLPVVFTLLLLAVISKASEDTEIDPAITMLMALGLALFGFFLPRILVKNTSIKRMEEINLTFPDALDMMLICVQGGIGLEQTVDRVAMEVSEHSPILAEELAILSAEMAMLNDRRTALSDFGRRVGGYGKSFATALIQAEQYGTSVSQALRVISDELRDLRMSKAEEKAASLPPKLTVPMIVFFLPVLFVVILGPSVIKVSETF